jgi:hypothetical protein
LLAYFSEYFNALLYRWSGVNENFEVAMPEDVPRQIKVFVEWIYSGTIPQPSGVKPEMIWLLGNKLLAPELCNDAMYRFGGAIDATLARRTEKDAVYLFENTTKGSPLRDYITINVRYSARRFNGYWKKEPEAEFDRKWWELLEAEGPIPDPSGGGDCFFMKDRMTYDDEWQPGQKFIVYEGW